MPIACVLLMVLLAGPAGAGESVRYQMPDGSVGFVDDERRLPPDAIIVSRTPLTPPPGRAAETIPDTPDPVDPAEPFGGAAAEEADAVVATAEPGDCAAHRERSEQLECWRKRGEDCGWFGLPLRCSAEDLAMAQSWCDRGRSLRNEWTPIEDRLATAVENHRACRSGSRPGIACSREEVLAAERAVEVWELRLSALEEQCHEQGCIPGWVRESCEVSARH